MRVVALAVVLGCNSSAPPEPDGTPSLSTPRAAVAASAAAPSSPAALPAAPGAAPYPPAGAPPAAPRGILGPVEADRYVKVNARPTVKLLDPGAEPRAPLTYAFAAGKRALGARIQARGRMTTEGSPSTPTQVPRTVMIMDVTTGGRDPRGEVRVEGRLRSLGFDGPPDPTLHDQGVVQGMGAMFPRLEGLTMSYAASPKGHLRDFARKLPEGAEDLMNDATTCAQPFVFMTVPLPDEPVGPGARWHVVTRLDFTGGDFLYFTTYTLEAREGNRADLVFNLVQLIGDPAVVPPLPPGIRGRFVSSESSGEGRSVIDLTSAAPVSSTVSLHSFLGMGIVLGLGDKEVSSTLQVDASYETFRPAP
ncbi:hypothetical protein [Chondromyces apiculatus]|uniref:Uncharacterized protein n=1 Tax=Chondromyces apiculatus DSM 436 TaxID=1192034 RepID=A0A017TFK3_9BACT|nr:hypothetical protein [Chondromyces apiculatus]EYF07590.1 Hypothetical protein CAP_8713 [Chondromyces apiculatus DSM 436]